MVLLRSIQDGRLISLGREFKEDLFLFYGKFQICPKVKRHVCETRVPVPQLQLFSTSFNLVSLIPFPLFFPGVFQS